MYPVNNADEHPSLSQKFPGEREEPCVVHWHPASIQDRLFHSHPCSASPRGVLFFYFYTEELLGVLCSLQREPEGKIVPELQPLRWEWFGRLAENSWAQQKHPGAIKRGSYFCAVLVVVWGFFQEVLSVNALCNFGSAQGGFVWLRLSHGEAEGKAFLPGCCISFSQE